MDQAFFGNWAKKFHLEKGKPAGDLGAGAGASSGSKANSMVNLPVVEKRSKREPRKARKAGKTAQVSKKKYQSKKAAGKGEAKKDFKKQKSGKIYKTGEKKTWRKGRDKSKGGKAGARRGAVKIRKKKGNIKARLKKSFMLKTDESGKRKSGDSGKDVRLGKYENFTEIKARTPGAWGPGAKEGSPSVGALPVFLFSKKSKSYNASLMRTEMGQNAFKKKGKRAKNFSSRQSPNVAKRAQGSRSPNIYRKKKFFTDCAGKSASPGKKFSTNQLAKQSREKAASGTRKAPSRDLQAKVSLLDSLREPRSEEPNDFIGSQSNSTLPQSTLNAFGVSSSCIESVASRTAEGPLLPFTKPSRKRAKKAKSKFARGQSSPKRNLYSKKPKRSARVAEGKSQKRSRSRSRSRSTRKHLSKKESYLQKYRERKDAGEPRKLRSRRGPKSQNKTRRARKPKTSSKLIKRPKKGAKAHAVSTHK